MNQGEFFAKLKKYKGEFRIDSGGAIRRYGEDGRPLDHGYCPIARVGGSCEVREAAKKLGLSSSLTAKFMRAADCGPRRNQLRLLMLRALGLSERSRELGE